MKLPEPWKQELTIAGVLIGIVAVILGVCGLLGDKLAIGPYP